jgi:hypothetical protein
MFILRGTREPSTSLLKISWLNEWLDDAIWSVEAKKKVEVRRGKGKGGKREKK